MTTLFTQLSQDLESLKSRVRKQSSKRRDWMGRLMEDLPSGDSQAEEPVPDNEGNQTSVRPS